MAHNLVDNPLIECVSAGQSHLLTLPQLFHLWGNGRKDVSLDGVRNHQRSAVHMFLCQLAASAILIANDGEGIDASEDVWRNRILQIAPLSAWNLIATQDDEVAFLQPPAPLGERFNFNRTENFPDALTILVTSKNHSIKQDIISQSAPWHWIVSLIELQTMSGYPGSRNYGIFRMNGGLASRPLVAIYPDMADGSRWLRDVSVIVRKIDDIYGKVADGFYAPSGHGLIATWVRSWDGESQLALSELHPLFIEVSRRVRLQEIDGAISAKVGNSNCCRIAAPSALCGVSGDPWAPLQKTDNKLKVLTLSGEGLTLSKLSSLVTGNGGIVQSLLQATPPDVRTDMYFHASFLVRGQGKTEGLHETTIPIPARKVYSLTQLRERASLGKLAELMVADASTASWKLKDALLCFSQGGCSLSDLDRRDPKVAFAGLAAFAREVEHEFFPYLWDMHDEKRTRKNWQKHLLLRASKVLKSECQSIPVRSEMFYMAQNRARGVLFGTLIKAFEISNAKKHGDA